MDLDNWQQRTELLIGSENIKALRKTHILVVGLGGVGGMAAEILCRSGVGNLTIVDADTFHSSNRNRQIGALKSTVGMMKTEVMQQRLLDINPEINIETISDFITQQSIQQLTARHFDYIVDAIDSLNPKIFLIYYALKNHQKIISSMGAGGKTNPALIQITNFSKTYNDKLARMLRKRMHKMDVASDFEVVFSPELINKEAVMLTDNELNKKTTVGTLPYMPMMFGAHIAAHIIRNIADIKIIKN